MSRSTLGTALSVTLFGESHGPAIGAVVDGLAPGIPVDEAFIAAQMDLRRPYGALGTGRREADAVEILSGVFRGRTTGTPVCVMIRNADAHSADYEATRWLARPGHADWTAFAKYHGFEDYRGGGHFSGRLTAALVAAGALVIPALRSRGILVGTHIAECAGIADAPFAENAADLRKQLEELAGRTFAVLDEDAGAAMRERIEAAAADGDSVGGILECAVAGLPAGVGEPWFDTLEGLLAHGLFAIPAVKGVEFGAGFACSRMRGSTMNDAFRMAGGAVTTVTNNNGGINGGISNGSPVVLRCAVKPTPSIFKEQETVDFGAGENATLALKGRHDPAIVHRARVVVDSVVALVLTDALTMRFGTDWLAGQATCRTTD